MTEPVPTPGSPPPAADPLAVALSRLDPAPHGFDRDALMFAAGGETKARLLNLWKGVAAAALAAAVTFATLYFTRPTRGVYIDRPVVMDRAAK
jgi:hypothetical protein